jgi:cell division protein FtsW (lipid II flippase)
MKALLPVYCRPLGYSVIALALFLPFLMLMVGKMTDGNLLFYKECSKLLMMLGAVMILFAFTKNESKETEQIRNQATRNAIFLTVLFIFGGMLYRVWKGDIMSVDTSSFLIFLILNVLCLEFGIKKATVDRLFKRDRR